MLNIQFKDEEYEFSSIEEADLDILSEWIKSNNDNDNTCYSLDNQIFYRRFLEYYMTDSESFIKVCKEDKIVAVFKGRLELEKKRELFIWLFVMDKSLRNKGIGTKIINSIMKYFKEDYAIEYVEAGVVEDNSNGIKFWNSLNFNIERTVDNFFDDGNGKERNLVIMKKENNL